LSIETAISRHKSQIPIPIFNLKPQIFHAKSQSKPQIPKTCAYHILLYYRLRISSYNKKCELPQIDRACKHIMVDRVKIFVTRILITMQSLVVSRTGCI